MHDRLSLATAALGLALASWPAGAGDIAQIVQTGLQNNATIEQIVSNGNNTALLRQDAFYANAYDQGNQATLLQHNVGNAVIDVQQSEQSNSANVLQHDGFDLQATIVSSGNYMGGNSAGIEQTGHGVRARVDQGGFANGTEIVQRGLGDVVVAEVSQWGDFHRASIAQVGSGLSATVVHSGSSFMPSALPGNTATIRQGY